MCHQNLTDLAVTFVSPRQRVEPVRGFCLLLFLLLVRLRLGSHAHLCDNFKRGLQHGTAIVLPEDVFFSKGLEENIISSTESRPQSLLFDARLVSHNLPSGRTAAE